MSKKTVFIAGGAVLAGIGIWWWTRSKADQQNANAKALQQALLSVPVQNVINPLAVDNSIARATIASSFGAGLTPQQAAELKRASGPGHF